MEAHTSEKPVIYFATDHAGFELKERLLVFVRDELGYEVRDCGAYEFNGDDDYPDFISRAAAAVSQNPTRARGIILGGSGQGEAMVANRFPFVRAAVFYGQPPEASPDAEGNTLDMIAATRMHNDANILSIGARFVSSVTAQAAVADWLETAFSHDVRHIRRIAKIESVTDEGVVDTEHV